MDNHHLHPGSDYTGPCLLVISFVFNMLSIMDKATITFVLSTIVSILAGMYYIMQMRKLRRDSKK